MRKAEAKRGKQVAIRGSDVGMTFLGLLVGGLILLFLGILNYMQPERQARRLVWDVHSKLIEERPGEALRLLRQVERLDSRNHELQEKMARVLSRQGRHEEALARLERWHEMVPDGVVGQELCALWERAGRLTEAANCLERYLEDFPDQLEAARLAGELEAKLSKEGRPPSSFAWPDAAWSIRKVVGAAGRARCKHDELMVGGGCGAQGRVNLCGLGGSGSGLGRRPGVPVLGGVWDCGRTEGIAVEAGPKSAFALCAQVPKDLRGPAHAQIHVFALGDKPGCIHFCRALGRRSLA